MTASVLWVCMTPEISLIASLDEERGIGKSGQLLVRIPDDLKRFRQLTTGHPIIMGRRTFDSIGRPLPQRTNIVITRNPDYQQSGVVVAHSLDEALEKAFEVEQREVFVIGGAQIYAQSIDRANRLYLTLVEDSFRADIFFPDYSDFKRETFREEREFEQYKYKWINLEPIPAIDQARQIRRSMRRVTRDGRR